ncbi:trehalase [Pseudoscourfieldia marina]
MDDDSAAFDSFAMPTTPTTPHGTVPTGWIVPQAVLDNAKPLMVLLVIVILSIRAFRVATEQQEKRKKKRIRAQRRADAVRLFADAGNSEGLLASYAEAQAPRQDSKEFVDGVAHVPAKKVLEAFRAAFPDGAPREASAVRNFVSKNFSEGGGLVPCTDESLFSRDAAKGPPPLALLRESENASGAAEFAQALCKRWRELVRVPDASCDTSRSSFMVPMARKPLVVPGSRFREVYYWDSYWVVLGLLACGLDTLAKGVVQNLISLVAEFGFVPNGTRIYYVNRSQPPLLALMVLAVHDATRDDSLLAEALPELLREYEYWTGESVDGGPTTPNRHTVAVRGRSGAVHMLQRYYARTDAPRPESYREDVKLAAEVAPEARAALLRHVASAAESGYDFGSRWFASPRKGLRSIRTTHILPSDLNAYLLAAEDAIATLARRRGDVMMRLRFADLASHRRAAMEDVFWDATVARWRDVVLPADVDGDVPVQRPTPFFHEQSRGPGAHTAGGFRTAPRNGEPVDVSQWSYAETHGAYEYVPLFCGAATAGGDVARAAVRALCASGLVQPGGVAVSTTGMPASSEPVTAQQWDWPNAWAPLQHMLSEGVRKYGDGSRVLLNGSSLDHTGVARYIARSFVRSCYLAWRSGGVMHEKMRADVPGDFGGGGEYTPQVGFGWTNGVCLELLKIHGGEALI